MKINEVPPPTAPRGYWANIQTEREGQLESLLGRYGTELAAIFKKRDEQLNQEQAAINSEIDRTIADARDAADVKRTASLTEAQTRFANEQAELDAEDKIVFQMASSLVTDQTELPRMKSFVIDGTREPAPIGNNIASLVGYRTALAKSINVSAQHVIRNVSRRLHIKLIKYRAGEKDITGIFVDAMKNKNWKVS
jgi:hypothetical protein